jgi:hypothetical protein
MAITVPLMTTPTKPNAPELLNDPTRLTLSMAQAAQVLGISKSTASHQYKRTGYLTEGVRVLRIGKRCVVSCAELRRALGLSEPTNQ